VLADLPFTADSTSWPGARGSAKAKVTVTRRRDGDREGDGERDGDGDRDGEGDGDGDREGEGDREGDGDGDGDREGEGDREGDGDGDGDREGDGDRDGEREGDGDREGDRKRDGDREVDTGGDGEGGAEGYGDPAADRGAGERDAPGDAVRSAMGPPAEGVGAAGWPGAGEGWPLSDDRPPGGLGVAPGVEKPLLSARVVAWAPYGPPVSSTAIPPAATAAATAPTPATAPGCRRTSCHHPGPAGTIGFGKPVRPNGSARYATLTR
jgi:hypothetical protein